jgi:endonuclease YncB( thermonuclease family)
MMMDRYLYDLHSCRVVDGDTLFVSLILQQTEHYGSKRSDDYYEIDHGFNTFTIFEYSTQFLVRRAYCRLMGIDAPEWKPLRSRPAAEAVANVARLWSNKVPIMQCRSLDRGPYRDRFVGHAYNQDGDSLAEYLLSLQVVKPAPDGKRQSWLDDDLAAVIERSQPYLK